MNKRIFLLGLVSVMCSEAAAMQASPDVLELRIDKVSVTGQVTVSLHNRGKGTLRVWRRGTEWGSARWRILRISQSGGLHTYYEDPRRIYKSLPLFDELSPGKPLQFTYDLSDGWWLPRSEETRRDEAMWSPGDTVIAVYDIPISEEAQKHGVWYGVVAAMAAVQ